VLSSSEVVGVVAASADEGEGEAVSEVRSGCFPGCDISKYTDFSIKGTDEGFRVCVTVMKTVVGGGAEGVTVTVATALDFDLWCRVLVRCDVLFESSSKDVLSVTVEGGVHTTRGPMGRPVMVMLAQGVVWAVEMSVVLACSVTIVAIVGIGVRHGISSESWFLFAKVGEAPTVLICCVPYLVESVVLEIVLLG
jgi:hypothetical protein